MLAACNPYTTGSGLNWGYLGGGLIAGRIANELGIARKVTGPVKESSNQPKPADIPQQR